MHLIANNPAVSLATRRWLRRHASQGKLLDAGSLELLEKPIARCAGVNPAGMVHDLASSLGAPAENALLAGSVTEIFYAVCSLTDDLQDGDTDPYLGHVPLSLQINVLTHLLCLVAVRCQDLAVLLNVGNNYEIVAAVYRIGATMLTGQRVEIMRTPWDIDEYEKVARMSAGEQFGLYCRLAAMAAEVAAACWIEYGRAFGTLLQFVVDAESEDPRLMDLAKRDRKILKRNLIAEIRAAATPLGALAEAPTEVLVRRCP